MNLSLRKMDFLLFFVFAAAAALIAALTILHPAGSGQSVRIISGGEEFGLYPLEKDTDIEILRNGHRNLVTIKDHTVEMAYSDCKNQICVNTGRISETGDMIVCLPNYVIVEIISNEEGGEDDEAIDAVVK